MGWNQLSLRTKLLATHLLVVAVGVSTSVLVVAWVAPRVFADHMAAMMGPDADAPLMGPGGFMADPPAGATLAAAFAAALTQAIGVGAAVAGIVAVLASLVVTGVVARPLRRIAAATRRIAAGHYAERVDVTGLAPGDDLGQLARSFNAMTVALESTERRRVELFGDVAHELRTPISTLEGYLEGLLDGVVAPTPETWARLHDEARRLHRLVTDLQELSCVEGQQLSLQLAAVDPARSARTVRDRVGPVFAEKGLQLVIQIPPGLPPTHADPDRVVQVLTNLLLNALRYTPAPGQVTLTVSRVPGGADLLFQVADTGVGLAPDQLSQVFERFYRVDKARSRAAGGSGIGLTIARALVEAMGGRIWAASAGPAQGSTFSFTLPVLRGG